MGGFRAYDLGFRVRDVGLRVWGFRGFRLLESHAGAQSDGLSSVQVLRVVGHGLGFFVLGFRA